MKRRGFLQLAGALPLLGSALVAGCGGGGGGGAATQPLAGRAVLPSGSTLQPSTLAVGTGLGSAALQQDSSFTAPISASATSPTLAWVQQGEQAILLGFVDPTHTQIDSHSTAVALLYLTLGGFAATVESKPILLDRLRAHTATTAFAATLETVLASKPNALASGDATLGKALKAAYEKILTERPGRAQSAPSRGRQTPTIQMLLTPTEVQSGVKIDQGTAPQTIVATNQKRRYCQVMTYEINREDANGVKANPSRAKLVSSVYLPSTPALGFLSTGTGFFSGETAFVPVVSSPITLNMNPGDSKTYLETVVLGSSSLVADPPIYGESLYADEVTKWREIRTGLNMSSWVADVLLGLLLELWGVRDLAKNEAAIQTAAQGLGKFLTENYFTLYDYAAKGNFVGATKLALELLTTEPKLFDYMYAMLVTISPGIQKAVGKATVSAATKVVLALVNAALAVVGLILGAGDLGAVLWDLANSEPTERWQETLIRRDIKVGVTPTAVTIAPGDSQAISAVVTGAGSSKLVYKWTLSGNLANISDGAGKVGASFETDKASVNLATTPSTLGTLTVTVEVIRVDAGNVRTSEGTATSTITVSDDVPYGKIRLRFTSFNDGGTGATGATRLMSIYETPRKQVQGGQVFFTSTHWKFPSAVAAANHDDLRMVIEFPTKTITVGSKATFRDAYGCTIQLATSANTEVYLYPSSGTLTVTAVGNGYFTFTMTANLVGLRDAPVSGTAILTGWIAGYTE